MSGVLWSCPGCFSLVLLCFCGPGAKTDLTAGLTEMSKSWCSQLPHLKVGGGHVFDEQKCAVSKVSVEL